MLRLQLLEKMKMYCQIFAVFLLVCLAFNSVVSQDKPKEYKVGEPQFKLDAVAGGNSKSNFGGAYNAGIGTKVWESKNKDKSLELGATYGRGFQRVDGHTYKSNPQYGLGGTFRWGKKR